MKPTDYLQAARVPQTLRPQQRGLWTIERRAAPNEVQRVMIGWPDYTLLRCVSGRSIHLADAGEVVMEDSRIELSKHLPIWLNAHGRVLVTGLGLGCVVRGLLANPRVTHIDVVEIDSDIIRMIWPEFKTNERLLLRQGDALKIEWPPGTTWDFAWHDLWTDGDIGLQRLHGQLLIRMRKQVRHQGAWAFPREFARLYSRKLGRLLGAPNYRCAA